MRGFGSNFAGFVGGSILAQNIWPLRASARFCSYVHNDALVIPADTFVWDPCVRLIHSI